MKKLLLAVVIFTGFACKKNKTTGDKQPTPPGSEIRCGTILNTPTLDSFVYPTYYITTVVAFSDGNEIVHIQDNVTGDHDSSWYLPKYAKDSSYCTTVP